MHYLAILKVILACIIVFYQGKRNSRVYYLAGAFLVLALHNISVYVLVESNNPYWVAVIFRHTSPFFLLLGPLLLFYYRGTLHDRLHLGMKDSLHLLPFLLSWLNVAPYLFLPFADKLDLAGKIIADLNVIKSLGGGFLFSFFSYSLGRWGITMAYLFYIGWLLWQHSPARKALLSVPGRQYRVVYAWLLILFLLIMSNLLVLFGQLYRFQILDLSISSARVLESPLFLISFFLYAGLSISMLLFPRVLYGPHTGIERPGDPVFPSPAPADITVMAIAQEEHSLPPEMTGDRESFVELAEKIRQYLETERPYLRQDFSMSELAKTLGVQYHHVYYCFANVLKEKFPTLRNRLRVEHAKKQLQDPQAKNITIEAVGQQAGFSSKAIFYAAFKKETGLTPSAYIRMLDSR